MDDQSDDPQELERKIDQATRIASRVNDQTTVERLRAWIEDMKQLRQRLEARRIKHETTARAGGLKQCRAASGAIAQEGSQPRRWGPSPVQWAAQRVSSGTVAPGRLSVSILAE